MFSSFGGFKNITEMNDSVPESRFYRAATATAPSVEAPPPPVVALSASIAPMPAEPPSGGPASGPAPINDTAVSYLWGGVGEGESDKVVSNQRGGAPGYDNGVDTQMRSGHISTIARVDLGVDFDASGNEVVDEWQRYPGNKGLKDQPGDLNEERAAGALRFDDGLGKDMDGERDFAQIGHGGRDGARQQPGHGQVAPIEVGETKGSDVYFLNTFGRPNEGNARGIANDNFSDVGLESKGKAK